MSEAGRRLLRRDAVRRASSTWDGLDTSSRPVRTARTARGVPARRTGAPLAWRRRHQAARRLAITCAARHPGTRRVTPNATETTARLDEMSRDPGDWRARALGCGMVRGPGSGDEHHVCHGAHRRAARELR